MIYGNNSLDGFSAFKMSCVGIGLGLGAGLITCLAVRCPRCSARWLWMAVSEQSHTRYLKWLAELNACPRCGYPGTASRAETGLQEESVRGSG
jgi:DNA-directed RNA polymerase subunit RPC12/RpoP